MKTINPSTSLRVNGKRSRTIKFYTLGCKVNQYETQSIREQFIGSDFQEIEDGAPAEIYLINTCTVTQNADRDSRHLIYCAHRQNPGAKIIVTGCYTELDSAEIAKIPGVTHVIKNKDKDRIIELFSKRVNEHIGITNFSGHTRAFLKIQDGCNNVCAYCKVPLVRGASRSRLLSSIVQEAEKLVKNDFKEIVLCGICLGAYGRDLSPQSDLIQVIEALENIKGLYRIRLSSIEAGDVSDSLIQKIAESNLACRQAGKLCRHLHIPIQSGDDEILKKMHRRYSRLDYINLIAKIKKQIPQIAITTDVLVGFPGENEENFQNTINLVQEIVPLRVHTFSYSSRNGAPASYFEDKIEPKVIKQRISLLKNIAQDCSLVYKKQFLNQDIQVLIETRAKEKPEFWEGYSDNYIKVGVASERNLKNQLIKVKLKKIGQGYLWANYC